MNKIFHLVLSIILGGVLVSGASAQTPSTLNISIRVDDPAFERGRAAIVHVKIKWGSVPDAKPQTLNGVSIWLTKAWGPEICAWGDCIGATFSPPNEPAPKDGEIIEFDVALNELYWNDLISSSYDLSEPKNMFNVIARGSYSLFVSMRFPANNSTKRDPRFIDVRSNSISVDTK